MDALQLPYRVVWLALILHLWSTKGANMHDPVAKTDKGRVRGLRQYPLGKPVDTYYGIPFAKPPINELRFRHPQPMDPWRGIFNATRKPNCCMQDFDKQFGNFSGSTMWNPNTDVTEDCLYLSVWAPRVDPPFEDKTVMVWIYGGGFYSGSSMLDIYDPTYFVAENDVIVVAMNYRVGPLGFLSLAHPALPGNAGMYDQLLALDWVQTNIHFFGGNPRKVTIFGESAGSVSVSMHLLSPLSRGKFNRAIMESGVANCDWAVLSIAEARRRALALVDLLKCNSSATPEKIVSCLRELPSESFHKNEWIADPGIGNSIVQFPFVPIVDGSFLVENPDESLKRKNFKKTPIIIGSNGNEGTWFLLYLHQDHFRRDSESLISKIRFGLEMQALFQYYPQYPRELNPIAQRAVKFQYTNWRDQDDQATNRHMIDQAVADRHFVCEINEFAYAYAKSGQNVYSYSYTYRSSQSPWPLWMGTIHADEINYVLGEPLNPNKNYEHKEKIFSRKIMTYWTNFAKTGDPNRAPGEISLGEWPLHTTKGREYLHLDRKHLHTADKSKAIGHGPRINQCAFWKEYLPDLVAETADITDMERAWKIQFHDYSTRHIVDWRHQFDNFLSNHQRRLEACGGGGR